MVYDDTKARAGHRSRGITEADLSLPLRRLDWIATLLLVNLRVHLVIHLERIDFLETRCPYYSASPFFYG